VGVWVICTPPRRYLWAALGALAVAGFVINLGFVAVSKTSLVVAPVLFLLFGIRFLKPRAMALLFLGGAVIAALVLASSPYLRKRVSAVLPEVQSYFKSETASSSGERLEYWKKAITFVSEAPVIGHGTGSIADLYRRAQSGEGLSAEMTENPHNQTAAVAIQLGLLGVAILWAMWLAHLWMFRAQGLAAWTGFVLVVQNVIASAFNSHLFDFTEGWTYVIGVGIAGGRVRPAKVDY
jgi:O-antigen ligase